MMACAERWDRQKAVDDDYCTVALVDGRPANVALLAPERHIDLLHRAAERYGLDGAVLEAAARSALALPGRVVVFDVLTRAAA